VVIQPAGHSSVALSVLDLTAEGLTVDVVYNGVRASRLRHAAWRKSRHSNPSGNCVEAALLPAGGVAVRNSRYPDGPALIFTQAEWDAFILGARDGEFDGGPGGRSRSGGA
jgi:hypothetical protein